LGFILVVTIILNQVYQVLLEQFKQVFQDSLVQQEASFVILEPHQF